MEGANYGQENHKGNTMKKIVAGLIVCSLVAIGVFAFTPKPVTAMPGECNFNTDCGVGMLCVGQYGRKYCVPK